LGKKPIKKTKRNKKKDKKRSKHAGLEQATRLGLFNFLSFYGANDLSFAPEFFGKKIAGNAQITATKDHRKVRIGVFTPEKSIFNHFFYPKSLKYTLYPLKKLLMAPNNLKISPKSKKDYKFKSTILSKVKGKEHLT
jgi:hypothetical protein